MPGFSAYNGSNRLGGTDYGISPFDFSGLSQARGNATQASVAASNALAARNATEYVDQAKAQSDANNARIDSLMQGRLDQLKGDPVDQMVLAALQQRSGPDAGPYDATTRNAMFTKQAEMAAAAMKNQAGHLAGNISDPSYQAQLAQLQSARQKALQSAQLGIDQTANLANYDARGQALGQLGSFNQAHNAAITNQNNSLAGLLADRNYASQSDIYGGAAGGMPGGGATYTTTTTLGGGGSFIPFQATYGTDRPAQYSAPAQGAWRPGLAGSPAQVHTAPSVISTPGAQSASGGHTLTTGTYGYPQVQTRPQPQQQVPDWVSSYGKATPGPTLPSYSSFLASRRG